MKKIVLAIFLLLANVSVFAGDTPGGGGYAEPCSTCTTEPTIEIIIDSDIKDVKDINTENQSIFDWLFEEVLN